MNSKKEFYIDRELTQREREIIGRSSIINKIEFIPWNDTDASKFDSTMYKDTYDYQLPPDLRQKGCYFEDPTRIFNSICVINRTLDPFCVVQVCLLSLLHSQNNVSDCTIISSMISCALYESRFKKPLISGILYPQANSQPAVNRFGKYYIRLFFNGIPRRVEVDHRILIKPNHRPVGTFSKVDGELWPSLIEKAFLKAHGGFGYHGGNGCQDTYILTGWIPENINLKDETEGNISQIWTRLYRAFRCVFHPSVECRAGDCIITSGTTADIPATTNPWIERRTASRPVAPTPRMPVPPMPQRPQPPDDPEDPLPALMWRMDKYLAEAGYALEQRRLHLVADAAGRLAAEAESYGFRVLGRMARCVESAGRAKDLQAVTDLLPELATAVERHRISMGS